MKISDTLLRAADLYLSEDARDYFDDCGRRKFEFSCDAVLGACEMKNSRELKAAHDFMEKLGCSRRDFHAFDEFPKGEVRQGARYLWLDFARLVAEDEGL